jgi:hypothetical protein
MTNDADDTEIWYASIWLFLVSKEAFGTQLLHPMIWFWMKPFLKMQKLKKESKKIPFDQTLDAIWSDFWDS